MTAGGQKPLLLACLVLLDPNGCAQSPKSWQVEVGTGEGPFYLKWTQQPRPTRLGALPLPSGTWMMGRTLAFLSLREVAPQH